MKSKMPDVFDEVEEVANIAEDIYDKLVGDHFKEVKELSERVKRDSNPITDAELEVVLTSVPLKLFGVSSALSKAKLTNEIVKIKNKEVDDKLKSLDYMLASAVYDSIILRIEKEILYSRELVMACKKIWDGRRSEEETPIRKDVQIDLPDYSEKTYIK